MAEQKHSNKITILGIESSCDDTSAAVIQDGFLLSNVTASQAVHEAYGGVVPELASRAHEKNIVPTIDQAFKRAGVNPEELSAIGVTLGPGLMGSLLVGVSFAKGLAVSLGLPLISRSVDYLFPSAGEYKLIVRGADSASLRLSMPGERCGLLGTDQRGRDVFTLLIYGIRASLIIGVSATLIASLLGMSLGLVAGYAGGLCDSLIMRAVDILMSIPTLPILMVLAGIWGKGLWQLVLILSIFSWMGTARSVRALVLTLRESQWVESLRALGAKRSYILARHLVPETAPVLLANIALGVPGAILAEAGLAFLGLSDPRLISWGRMLHEAHSFGAFTEGAWWLLLPPGLGIVAVCLIFMDIGKFLEEKIDPRLGKK